MTEDPAFDLPQERGREILRVEVGSTLHGTGLPGGEDRDLMGVYIETPESALGLHQTEQWIRRSKPEGQRSEPGDTDLTVYSLRKYVRLALNGNPTVLLILFAPDDKIVLNTTRGRELRGMADCFASRRAGKAFLGYMEQQRQRMTGERGTAGRVRVQHTADGKRIVDWKYAMHMLRLGVQGIEFLTTGALTLPIQGEVAESLRAVRRGEVPMPEVLEKAERLEAHVKRLLDGESPLPAEPQHEEVERWMIRTHMREWLADVHNEEMWRST